MRAAFGRIGWMVRKELRQVFRDPRMARLVIVAPIVQLLVFGYAVSTDVRHTPTIVLDRDQSRDSRELVSALTAGGYFDVVESAQRDADLADALDHGRAALALATRDEHLRAPPGVGLDLRPKRRVLVDAMLVASHGAS